MKCFGCGSLTPCVRCVGKTWQATPPPRVGVYWWRKTHKWEPIERSFESDRMIYSLRFCQRVPIERLRGEWLY